MSEIKNKQLIWNLDDFFKDDGEFYKEIELLKKEWELLCYPIEFNAISLQEQLDKFTTLKSRTTQVLVYGNLKFYQNIKSDTTLKLKQDATDCDGIASGYQRFFEVALISLGIDTINGFILENDKLEKYRLYLENLFRLRDYMIESEFEWKNRKFMDTINKNTDLYQKTLNEMDLGKIIVDGKEKPLTIANYGRYLVNSNREIRKNSYIMANKAFNDKSTDYAKMLHKIFSARYKIAKLAGYNSVMDKALLKDNLDSYIIDNLILVVHNNLGTLRNHLKLKANYLGIERPHLYDLGLALGTNKAKIYSIDEAIKIIKEALSPLGEKYLETVIFLLENGHVDASLNEEKHQSITFSWLDYSFLNFKGTYLDLKNLVHELGHIVNYYLSKGNVCYLYEDSSVFVSEISAIVNEILLNRYLYNQAETVDEKIFFLSKSCENYFTSIFKQTMYTEFENMLYDRISDEKTLSSRFLNNTYFELVKKYYGDYVVYDKEGASEWTRLGHLYRHAYYPYQYATGMLMASIVVNSLLDDKSLTTAEYIKYLASGSSDYSLELLKILNIDWNQDYLLNLGFVHYEKLLSQLEELIKSN